MNIDTLQIQIQTGAKSAGSTIDTLVRKINKLSVSLNQLDGSRIIAFSSGIKSLANASQALSNIKTPDFNRLAKNLTAMNNLDLSKLNNVSSNIQKLAASVNGISGIAGNISQITELSKSLSQLGYKSAEKAATNIPKLATSVNDLMTKLSKAPKVSQNIIDMTNALAKLARTGASSGRAANSLSTAFNALGRSSNTAYSGISKLNIGVGSLRGLFSRLAPILGAVSLVNLGKQAIDTASSLTEVQNVVTTTFGEYSRLVEDMAKTSIQDYGMSELTTKKISSRFQAMGTAMGFTQGKMAGMSIELTKLAGDMASFYDVEQNDVAKSLQSVFTGETEPLRKYGLDITNATLKQWALNNGLNANITSMSQAEKAMLRYQYVMANTTAAQGDFAKTSGSWANQVRILSENFKALGSVVGQTLINAFKPMITWLNRVVMAVTSAVKTIANALGAIFGWTIEVTPGGSALDDTSSGFNDIGTSADNAGNSMGGAADKAKELKKALMGFDEIEKLPDPTSSSGGSGGSGGGGGTGGAGSADAGTASLIKTESILEKYKSSIKSLEQLGEYIGDALSTAMENIDWDSIYGKARNFGKGLADFLNGLISPRLFYNVGRTIANSLNTAFEFLNSFGKTFDWNNFGESIGSGINGFFKNWKPKLAASTFNAWANGILDTMIKAMRTTDWEEIGRQIGTFLAEIDWKGVLYKIGVLIWEAIKAAIKATTGLFGSTAGSVEGTIVAALLALKFGGIGYTFASTVWGKISESILGKTISMIHGRKIGTGVSNTIMEEIENGIEKTSSGSVGEKLWSNLEKVAKSPFKQAAVYTAIIQLGVEIDKLSDKLQGGNGKLTEMGGIFDNIAEKYSPALAKKIFQLKEQLEDEGASSDVVKEKMSNLFKAAGISAESFETVLNDVAGSGTVTAEQMDILKGILKNLGDASDTTAKKTENTQNAYKVLRDKLVELQKQGIIPSQEHMDALLNTLDKQEKSGATASQALKAVTEDMDTFGIRTSETAREIDKTLGTAIDKTNKKGINVKAKVISDTKNIGKTLLDPITKLFGKNPFSVKTELKEKAKDIQKKLDKFNNLKIEPETKTKTTASQLQNQLNSLKNGYVMKFQSEVSNTSQNIQSQLNQKVSGFTLGVTAKAVFSKIEDKLSENQKTFSTKANFDSISDNLGDKKTFNTKANFNSRSDSLGSGNKTFDTKAKFTNRQDALSSAEKVISGITAKISSLQKASGLALTLTAVFSVLTSGLKLAFKENGGVFKNGRWSPITAYASGGLPNQGQLFVAREAGPELVGTMPGGGTGVINNNQIVASVSSGVYKAMLAAMSQVAMQLNRSGSASTINVYVGGRQITETVIEEINRQTMSTGTCPIIV